MINGSKQFITNSGTDITRFVTLTAVTGQNEGGKEISSIIVPNGTPGFTVQPGYDKVGWHASDTHPLTMDDVRVPVDNLLGERGRGFANFLHILDEGRIAIAALSTGAAEGCWRPPSTTRRSATCSENPSRLVRGSSSCSPG